MTNLPAAAAASYCPVEASPQLIRMNEAGAESTIFESFGMRELHLSIRPLDGETLRETARRTAGILARNGALVVRHEIFGSLGIREELLEAFSAELGSVEWPSLFVEGEPCDATKNGLAGMHLLAVAGAPIDTVRLQGRIVGRAYSDHWARHLLLGDIQPANACLPAAEQAGDVFEIIEAALFAGGMTMANVARTWFFLDKILLWYGEFNAVRNRFFKTRNVFGHLVPASTGVGVANSGHTAAATGVWASETFQDGLSVREASSPSQCTALDYGSSFSRAVELENPAMRRLMISGTASIEPGGKSVHTGDPAAQIELTMDVVEKILGAHGMDFSDASRATAYFKHPEDVRHFEAWRTGRGLGNWPVVCARADICRDELLFELEMDALKPA